jgi:4-amino-4-deoxy-L-arabinose transferase-like glycosyltransferase
VSVALRHAVPLALWVWIGTLVIVAGASLRRPVVGAVERLRADRSRAALALIVAASVLVNLVGIWWGLPSYWAGDEISPTGVLTALAQHFSNGWFDRYPPFQFHVLSAVFSPWLAATSLGWIHASDQVHLVTLIVLSRLVSVAAAAGTLVAIYVCGARVFNKRAGLLGAAMMALVPPFVFYAKTANPEVPYLFWFALSLVFCVRWLRTFAFRDIALFALAATLAVCTKDQAYALYLAMPFVMVSALWQRHRAERSPRALARALADARLWAAAAVAAAVFVLIHNIAFNPGGFVHHVRDITGPGSQGYRMVEPTLAGRLALLRLTLDLSQRSWGWPLFLVSLAGVIVALREAEGRRASICLALVVVSYYIGFIDVILYDYDRYLLPVCVVQAIFGGAALDRFLQSRRLSQPLRTGLVTAAFAYTVLYAATVDDLMVRDSRYTVERWLDGHVGPDEQIGTAFPVIVLPRLGRFHTIDIGTLDNLRKWAPAYYVLNADYARAVPPETPLGRLIAALQEQQAGYRLMLRYHSPSLWPWLPAPDPDLLGPRLETPSLSFLRDINPTIEVYERRSR